MVTYLKAPNVAHGNQFTNDQKPANSMEEDKNFDNARINSQHDTDSKSAGDTQEQLLVVDSTNWFQYRAQFVRELRVFENQNIPVVRKLNGFKGLISKYANNPYLKSEVAGLNAKIRLIENERNENNKGNSSVRTVDSSKSKRNIQLDSSPPKPIEILDTVVSSLRL